MKVHRAKLGQFKRLLQGQQLTLIIVTIFAVAGSVLLVRSFAVESEPKETISGEFIHSVADDFTSGNHQDRYVIRQAEQKYIEVDIDDENVRKIPETGSKVRIKTQIRNGKRELADQNAANIMVDAGPSAESTSVSSAQLSQEAKTQTAEGTTQAVRSYQRGYVIINFQPSNVSGLDIRTPIRSESKQRAFLTDATSPDKYWAETSYGDITLTSTLLGTVNIPISGAQDCSSASAGSWADKADAALRSAGKNPSSYTHMVYILPLDIDTPQTNFSPTCNWGGLGEINGRRTWLLFGFDSLNLGTPIATNKYVNGTDSHEFGHNIGLNHAASFRCTSGSTPVSYSNSCSIADTYGDYYDLMGLPSEYRLLSSARKVQLGIIPSTKVKTITASGTYTLASSNLNPTATPEAQSLRIAIPNSSEFLELEMRSPSGTTFDNYAANNKVVNGFTVRRIPAVAQGSTVLTRMLDATPSTAAFTDGTFVDEVFVDTTTNTRIKMVSRTSTQLVVTIELNGQPLPPGDTVRPSTTLTSPAAGSSHTVGSTVTVQATASDNVGVSKVEFFDGTTLIGTDNTSPYSVAWSTTSAALGAHSLTSKAYDAAGNTGTSAAVTVNVVAPADTTRPTVSLTAPANGGSATIGSTVSMAANAADNVGVTKVEFYAGTALLSSDTAAPYTYAWNTTGQGAGAKSLTARAYDAAGNTQTSAAITFTLNAVTTNPPGDANGDGRVNALDLSILLSKDGQNHPPADFNKDGTVGAADLSILLARWTW